MKHFHKILISIALLLIVCSCTEKISRVDFELSEEKIEASQLGGTYTIFSSVPDLELCAINILNQDGDWKVAKSSYSFSDKENPLDCTGLTYEWISIKKSKEQSSGSCCLTIEVEENKSGVERTCSFSIAAGDSGKTIILTQKN